MTSNGSSRSAETRRGTSRVATNKREERERRLRAQRRRFYLRVGFAAVILAALIGSGVSVYRSDVFAVEQIAVVGAQHLTVEHVREVAAVPDRATLLRLPSEEVKARLEADPWIAAATVSRDFPDTVRLDVVERVPVALVDKGDATFWLVDSSGYMIEQSAPATETALVVIRDIPGLDPRAGERTLSEPLLNALAVWEGLGEELRGRVRAISAGSIDKTALITSDDIEIFVGSADDIDRKDAVARRILEEQAGAVVYINVRSVERPTWRGLGGE